MAKYKIEYLPVAITDLEEIFEYIADDNIHAPINLLAEIDQIILRLEKFPEIGTIPKNR